MVMWSPMPMPWGWRVRAAFPRKPRSVIARELFGGDAGAVVQDSELEAVSGSEQERDGDMPARVGRGSGWRCGRGC